MRRFFRLEIIGSFASIVALIFFIFYQFIYKEEIGIEIQSVNKETITTKPDDSKLTANYYFNGSPISRLEKIHFLIKNNGTKTIIGQGNRKDIISESLPLSFSTKESLKVLEIEIVNSNFPITLKSDSIGNLNLTFKQWKINEYLEIVAYIENNSSIELPNFTINERDILNSTVTNTEFQPNSEKQRLINLFSLKIQNIIFGLVLIFFMLMLTMTFIEIRKQVISPDVDTIWFKIIMVVFGLIMVCLELSPLLWMIKI